MTMKKKILTTLSVVLILGMAAMGILAYLTSTDSDVNVMTLGNVDIEQHEYDENGKVEPNNDGFSEFGDLYPGTTVVKKVNVENIGESAAYVRTLVAFETITGTSNTFGYTPVWNDGEVREKLTTITVEDVTYDVYEFVYENALAKGETTEDSLVKVYLSEKSTDEDMEALGGTYEVLVLSQAGQYKGFEGVAAADALDTMFGDPEAKAKEWFSSLFAPKAVDTTEAIIAALENAEDGDVINVAGGTYNFIGTDLIIDKAITLQAADSNNKPVFKVDTSDTNTINHGIEIKSDNVILSGLKLVVDSGVNGSGNLVQISANGSSLYSNITIEGCEFDGSDHCIAMYGKDVTIKNCILDESNANDQGNIIYVWGTEGKLTIEGNEFVGDNQKKHGISIYNQSAASKASGEIIINNNAFRDVYKGVVHESSMTYTDVKVTISNNTFTNHKKKPVAIDNGTFDSYVISGNVFEENSDSDKCVIDNKVNTAVVANGNYWGYETPDWSSVISGSNVVVDNYYSDVAKTTLVNK